MAKTPGGITGSIPACAGEPRPRRWPRGSPRVDPRVCGGAPFATVPGVHHQGRSPRVRGSRATKTPPSIRGGSIPACAGEPLSHRGREGPSRVDPRVCGGADSTRQWPGTDRGRSPRVRGSPDHARTEHHRVGSIPACAGEPTSSCAVMQVGEVDPRVCGGAFSARILAAQAGGRSPRVRGSRLRRRELRLLRGSIPACAGEPGRRPRSERRRRVDPRVCGGATKINNTCLRAWGRSPRVRGSLGRLPAGARGGGSIPACAGEPPVRHRGARQRRVDPRVCGGAPSARSPSPATRGRSPRVRGSRVDLP